MGEENVACVAPTTESSTASATPAASSERLEYVERKASMDVARVGKKAPEFSGMAFVDDTYKQVKLSDYAGKWVMICFYPGDFTFV